jgi:hypothetical protein
VAVFLTPPLAGLGFLSTSLAPRGEKPKVAEMRIQLEYDLLVYYNGNLRSTTIVGTMLSRKTYTV